MPYGHDAPSRATPVPSTATLTLLGDLPGHSHLIPCVSVSHIGNRWRRLLRRPPRERPLGATCPHALSLPPYYPLRDIFVDRGYMSVDALCHALAYINRIRKIRTHALALENQVCRSRHKHRI